MKQILVLCVLIVAGLALAATWQEREAGPDSVFASNYESTTPMQVSVTNWPFDLNLNLKVSPRVLDKVIDFGEPGTVTSPWDVGPIDCREYTTIRIHANLSGVSEGCFLQWEWNEGGDLINENVGVVPQWGTGTKAFAVNGRRVYVHCTGDPLNIHYMRLYLRAEF